MSSELFMFDNSFFSDPFSLFAEEDNKRIPNDEFSSLLLSSSPPSGQLESLSLSQFTGGDYSALEVKAEDYASFSCFGNSLSLDEAAMQRSFSSNSFQTKQSFSFRPQFDPLLESQEKNKMRRVCSTGDLQRMKMNLEIRSVLSSSPLSADKAVIEEANFKVGRYSAEEKKERIERYKAKRTQRNFNKTIKYACRKTLADTRPRIRGRFARNDEIVEIPKASTFQRYIDEDDVWIDGFHEEKDEEIASRRMFFNTCDSTQNHNISY